MSVTYHRISELFRRMKKMGLTTGKAWAWREEKAGRFPKLRKSPSSGYRMLTENEIERIIDSYRPK